MGRETRRTHLWAAHDPGSPRPANRSLRPRPGSGGAVSSTRHADCLASGFARQEHPMSLTVQCMPESDGTLKYLVADHDVIVRVLAQRRNGTKKCPVELFHQAGLVLVTDCDLRQLRDVETLYKHANT